MIKMKTYKNKHGNSGVRAYCFEDDYILIEFKGAYYLYSYEDTEYEEVNVMREKAEKGEGLSEHISKYIRGQYEHKFTSLEEMELYLKQRSVKN